MLKATTKKRRINFFAGSKRCRSRACHLKSSGDQTITRRRPPPKRKKIKKKKQMHLDLGQRNFGAIKCPHCNMLYTPGTLKDEMIHAKFCSVISAPIRMSSKSVKVTTTRLCWTPRICCAIWYDICNVYLMEISHHMLTVTICIAYQASSQHTNMRKHFQKK